MILKELTRVQEKDGWISGDAARRVAEALGVPLHRVEGVLSFYPHFRREPPRRLELAVCRDMSCWLRGGEEVCRAARELGDDDVEVHEVSCLGRCDRAPAALAGDRPIPQPTAERLRGVVEGTVELDPEAPLAPRRWRVNEDLPDGPDFDPDHLIAELREAGLRGMGGAGFPTADKWTLVRNAPGSPKYVICNADESEPGTFKDRVILEELPELVVEGIALAALTVGAERAIVYIRHEYALARRVLERTLQRYAPMLPVPIELFVSPGGYIMGEETALLEALEDKRGEPRNKPPFPGTHGLHGKPTVINNVETLMAAAVIHRRGAAWWNAQGVRGAKGVKFMSVSGHVARPDVYEVPFGTTVRELLELAGGATGELLAFAPGGASSNFLGPDKLDTPLDFAPMQAAGSMLGSGALVVVRKGTDLLALATNVVKFFARESCGKCVPCRVGTEKAVVMLEEIAAGRRPRGELDALLELEETLRLTSICGLGQVALNPILSVRKLGHV
jgi:formate dehydrogenase beta subunit